MPTTEVQSGELPVYQLSDPAGVRLPNRRLHPFLSDVLLTGLAQGFILATNLLMVGLVSRWMGLVALGEFLLLKRVASCLVNGTQLGLGVALPREIAHTRENTEARARQYFAAAMVAIVPLLLVVGVIAILAAKPVAQLCFGSQEIPLVYALVFLLAGSGLQAMVFGYYRGLQNMRSANLVQLGGSVVIPLLALAIARSSRSTPLLVEIIGIGMVLASIGWAVPLLLNSRSFGPNFFSDGRRLLRYGIVRVPGDFFDAALLSLGPVLASHRASMEQVSFLLLGLTCLSMTSLAFWPVVMMLLAKISSLLGAGRLDDVREYVQHLRSAVLQISMLVTTQAMIFIGPLVRWWLGASYLPGVPVICIVMLAIPGFMYFHGLRSALDAASTTAYNTRNLALALAVFGAVSAAVLYGAPRAWGLPGIAVAMTISIYVLAVATGHSLRAVKLASQRPQMSSLWIVAVLAGVSLAAQAAFHFNISKPAFCMVLFIDAGLGLLMVRASRPEWVSFLYRVSSFVS